MTAQNRRERLDKQRKAIARGFINRQLTVATEPRTTPSGPLSAPVKARPPGLDDAVAEFLAKQRGEA